MSEMLWGAVEPLPRLIIKSPKFKGNFPDVAIPGSESYDNNPVTALCVWTRETYCAENRAKWIDCVITVSNTKSESCV